MREGRLVAGMLAAVVVLAGCGGGATNGTPAAQEGGAFPVTVTHGQGTVTIPRAPQRVVTLGLADQQIAAALGAPIVGATRNPSSTDGAWPGVSPQTPAEVRTLDPVTPNVEAIAALAPDLILMTSAQPAFSAAYAQISAIAPTISYKTQLLQDPGDQLVELIGRALGKDADAQALTQRSTDQLATFRAEHPGLQGKRYAFGQFVSGATYLVVAKDGPTARFFDRLGLRQPDRLAALPAQQAGIAQVPAENLQVLDDADVAFVGVASPQDERAFTAQPLVSGLELVRDGRVRFLTFNEAALVLQPNPASTAAALELLGPTLERL